MINNILYFTALVMGVISIVIATGIVWRVEKRLDISYKFLQISIILFCLGLVLEILLGFNLFYPWYWREIITVLFSLFFMLGVIEMRVLVRHLDGELPPDDK